MRNMTDQSFRQVAFTIASFTARWEIIDFHSQSTDFSPRKLIKSIFDFIIII